MVPARAAIAHAPGRLRRKRCHFGLGRAIASIPAGGDIMSFVFGPISSRRLGQSLGIDPIAFKSCHWNCIYCQLGRSQPMQSERREDAPVEAILAELRSALAGLRPGAVQWVTISGSGEPTLHGGLGRIIAGVKALTTLPVAVLTSGASLHDPEVRADLLASDAVLPTVSAGNEAVYRKLHRPAPDITFEKHVEGLVAFRREYPGQLWVEVMLVAGVNDSEDELRQIADVLGRIRPDAVHINQPMRPPAEPWVRPPNAEVVERAHALLGGARAPRPTASAGAAVGAASGMTDTVLGMLARHPMDFEELLDSLGRSSPAEVGEALARLAGTGRVRPVQHLGRRFWAAGAARFGEERTR
jgi:wyosine [tRNA(Phe)-imidazoG37] synthetase (radical SAM superfamily)